MTTKKFIETNIIHHKGKYVWYDNKCYPKYVREHWVVNSSVNGTTYGFQEWEHAVIYEELLKQRLNNKICDNIIKTAEPISIDDGHHYNCGVCNCSWYTEGQAKNCDHGL